MGGRMCRVFSIEHALIKKPSLYISVNDSIKTSNQMLLDVILHGAPTEEHLKNIWSDVDSGKKGYIDENDCEIIIREMLFSMDVYVNLQIKEGRDAIQLLIEKAAKIKGETEASKISEEIKEVQERFEQTVIEPNQNKFRLIKKQVDRDPRPMAHDLYAKLSEAANGIVTRTVFIQSFCDMLGFVFAKHQIEIPLPTSEFFPFGTPDQIPDSVNLEATSENNTNDSKKPQATVVVA